jgi:hypothetical protein
MAYCRLCYSPDKLVLDPGYHAHAETVTGVLLMCTRCVKKVPLKFEISYDMAVTCRSCNCHEATHTRGEHRSCQCGACTAWEPVEHQIHALKTWPVHYENVASGRKHFEYRKNDRNFQVGDLLILQKYDPQREEYLGENLVVKVTHMMTIGFGLPQGTAVLSIEKYKAAEPKRYGSGGA